MKNKFKKNILILSILSIVTPITTQAYNVETAKNILGIAGSYAQNTLSSIGSTGKTIGYNAAATLGRCFNTKLKCAAWAGVVGAGLLIKYAQNNHRNHESIFYYKNTEKLLFTTFKGVVRLHPKYNKFCKIQDYNKQRNRALSEFKQNTPHSVWDDESKEMKTVTSPNAINDFYCKKASQVVDTLSCYQQQEFYNNLSDENKKAFQTSLPKYLPEIFNLNCYDAIKNYCENGTNNIKNELNLDKYLCKQNADITGKMILLDNNILSRIHDLVKKYESSWFKMYNSEKAKRARQAYNLLLGHIESLKKQGIGVKKPGQIDQSKKYITLKLFTNE